MESIKIYMFSAINKLHILGEQTNQRQSIIFPIQQYNVLCRFYNLNNLKQLQQ